MENNENTLKTTLTTDDIEQMVQRYLEKTASNASSDRTAEELKIIEIIIEQATF